MKQATVNRIVQYANFFNDLRRIVDQQNPFPLLSEQRLIDLGNEFEALSSIVTDVRTDTTETEKEELKWLIKRHCGAEWPILLSVKRRNVWVDFLQANPAFRKMDKETGEWVYYYLTKEGAEGILKSFSLLLTDCNRLTARMAGAVGLMKPIDPVEAGKFFFDDFVKSDKWQRYIDKLYEFRSSNPNKRKVAILAYYIRNTQMARNTIGWTEWYKNFCNLLSVDEGTYRERFIDDFCADPKNEDEYVEVLASFKAIFSQQVSVSAVTP